MPIREHKQIIFAINGLRLFKARQKEFKIEYIAELFLSTFIVVGRL